MADQVVEVLIHGDRCPSWSEPYSVEKLKLLALIKQPGENGWTYWVCPACGESCYFRWDSDG